MELIYKLPSHYYESSEVVNLQNALNTEKEVLLNNLKVLTNDLFVLSCSNICNWEKLLNIKTDVSKDFDFRKTVVISKIRGQGTTTVSMIKNVAESFSNGEVDVLEDNSNYKFIVKFTGNKGTPPNENDLKNAIEEIKPAHLTVEYQYTYNTWDMIKSLTWGGASANTWEQIRVR